MRCFHLDSAYRRGNGTMSFGTVPSGKKSLVYSQCGCKWFQWKTNVQSIKENTSSLPYLAHATEKQAKGSFSIVSAAIQKKLSALLARIHLVLPVDLGAKWNFPISGGKRARITTWNRAIPTVRVYTKGILVPALDWFGKIIVRKCVTPKVVHLIYVFKSFYVFSYVL